MKHFLSFQKRKAFYLEQGTETNQVLAEQFNDELKQYGYELTPEMVQAIGSQKVADIDAMYHDVLERIKLVVPGGGYEPIYKDFPNTPNAGDTNVVKASSCPRHEEYSQVTLITKQEYENIFSNMIYGMVSLSQFDKEIVEYFLGNGAVISFRDIKFKEIFAYVGTKLIDMGAVALPTKDATNVLRIWSAYSGGDEGLKENTKFVNPKAKQRVMLLSTLEECYNLEDSFKGNREKWLRMLFYLHPMAGSNATKYPKVYKYTKALRNEPKTLKTFNSRIEKAIFDEDEVIFDLLKPAMGVFTRRLDKLMRVFGVKAMDKWLDNKPKPMQAITMYNHLFGRDAKQGGRSAVLAGASASEVVTYKDLEPMDKEVVDESRQDILQYLYKELTGKIGKVAIDPILYMRTLGANNRASGFSLDGQVTGSAIPIGKSTLPILRLYCMWEGRTDIDLSGMVIHTDNIVDKIGWNGTSNYRGGTIVYSGDNTGNYAKNSEYIDVQLSSLPQTAEWIVLDASIFSHGYTYATFPQGTPMTGFEMVKAGSMVDSWLPSGSGGGFTLQSASKTAYLSAYHVPTGNLIHLDVAMGNNNVSTAEDALKMRTFLRKFIPGSTEDEVSWDTIGQGHILEMLSADIVLPADADLVFTETTALDEVLKYI